MKKWVCIPGAVVLLASSNSFSQSVGINPAGIPPSDAKAMLEIRRPGFSKLKIRTDHYVADTSVIELSNRSASNLGTDIFFSLINEEGLLISSSSDIPANTKDSLFSLRVNGSAGFGIRHPAYNYHFHAPGSSNNLVSITTNSTGIGGTDGLLMGMSGGNAVVNNMEGTSLRLGTGNLTRLAIDGAGNVGVGTLVPVYKLDVNGDINLTGAMRLNGSAGTAGQVLTSNGTSDPQWKNAAYANTTRFSLLGEEGATANSNLNLTVIYNTNPADITVGASSITVNRSGLYHIEGSASIEESFSPSAPSVPDFTMNYSITPGATNFVSLMYDAMRLDDGVTGYQRYFFYRNFSSEVYIAAGSTVTFHPTMVGSAATLFLFNYSVRIRGHLISE